VISSPIMVSREQLLARPEGGRTKRYSLRVPLAHCPRELAMKAKGAGVKVLTMRERAKSVTQPISDTGPGTTGWTCPLKLGKRLRLIFHRMEN